MIKPHHRTVEAFQSWMEGEADGRGVPVLRGFSANGLLDTSDLIALHPAVEQDWLLAHPLRPSLLPDSLRGKNTPPKIPNLFSPPSIPAAQEPEKRKFNTK
jgi:hypothetical protein